MPFIKKLVNDTLKCCAVGETIYYGGFPQKALNAFYSQGVNIHAIVTSLEEQASCQQFFPHAVLEIDNIEQSLANNTQQQADTLVVDTILDKLSLEQLSSTLATLCQLTKRYAVFNVSTLEQDDILRNREWWVEQCITAGFRRHPRYMQVCSYEELNYESERCTIILEKIPDEVRANHPLEKLKQERDLHMDMLREAGRRSDAHVVRYHMAAIHISPGDTVLDCACGLGYGPHVLYNNSPAKQIIGVDLSPSSIQYASDNYGNNGTITFVQGDAQNLAFLPDNSVDFITSFETIEHLPNPEAYLKELARVLRPSGRIMLSAPNEWPIEEDAKPPYHCQVYTWQRFKQEIAEHFLLDRGFVQTAGGGGLLTNNPRLWKEVSVDSPLTDDAEWIALFAMKSPMLGRSVPFVETVHTNQPISPDYHATNYAGSYINPWLAKGMTTWPMSNPEQRITLSEQVIKEYPPQSADYGAALCVTAYRLLEKEVPTTEVEALLSAIAVYQAEADSLPHCVRWKISLQYVQAFLFQKIGNLKQAEASFEACAHMNPLEFSSMSATKVIDACYHAAVLALNRGDTPTAKLRLQHSITIGKQVVSASWFNVIGDEKAPVLFGLHDLTQTMDYLVRSGYALYLLESWTARPGQVLHFSKGLFERIIDNARSQENAWKNGYFRIHNELSLRDNIITDLQSQVSVCQSENAALQSQVSVCQSENAALQSQVSACYAVIEGYQNSKSWKITAPLRAFVQFFTHKGK
ncbi:class I SAM-dependent methyltransferase [Desulfovibrio cuneatus]|uniref:class I SAM-dependent methyltransferase n=1 Tax=Desulfovibrio cuneatus TaxID=159728 RepID=UPI00041BC1C1|nr:class I SAM-dependent methyltransferase [Desulfovibrio cuneatus]